MTTTNATVRTYTSSYKNLVITSDDLIAEFERRHMQAPASLIDLREHGCRYANQDFDVMGNAIRVLAGGNNFEHIYVELSLRRDNPFSDSDLEKCNCGHRRMGHLQGFGTCLRFLSGTHPGANCDCKRFTNC